MVLKTTMNGTATTFPAWAAWGSETCDGPGMGCGSLLWLRVNDEWSQWKVPESQRQDKGETYDKSALL